MSYVSPEYQERLDRLADTICQPSEYEQSLDDFDRVFCPRVPLSFFEDSSEALEPGFIQQRFEETL